MNENEIDLLKIHAERLVQMIGKAEDQMDYRPDCSNALDDSDAATMMGALRAIYMVLDSIDKEEN